MAKEQWFTCAECGEYTPLTYRTDYLGNGVQHVYAVCRSCEVKVTVYYTDKEIRSLLKKQKKTPVGPKKGELAKEIDSKMQVLKERMEAERENSK